MMSGIIFIYYSNDNIVIMLLLSLLFYVDINFIDSFLPLFFFTAFFIVTSLSFIFVNCHTTMLYCATYP